MKAITIVTMSPKRALMGDEFGKVIADESILQASGNIIKIRSHYVFKFIQPKGENICSNPVIEILFA